MADATYVLVGKPVKAWNGISQNNTPLAECRRILAIGTSNFSPQSERSYARQSVGLG